MSEASTLQANVRAPRRPIGLWLWALYCAAVAVGPIWFTWIARQWGYVSSDASLFAEYRGLGAWFYHGGSAACAVLLVRQSRHAVALALLVVSWVVYMLARSSWGWLQGTLEPGLVFNPVVKLVLWGLLLRFTVRQRRMGALR